MCGINFDRSSKSKPGFIESSFIWIEDKLTRNTITIQKDADLTGAVKIMIKQGIIGLPVIESPGNVEQPIRVISKTDIGRGRALTMKERAC